jgi:hypothetical protein
MVKRYVILSSNQQRQDLCRLIHVQGYTIKDAATALNIHYPNAKAVNKVYERERRIQKLHVIQVIEMTFPLRRNRIQSKLCSKLLKKRKLMQENCNLKSL